MRVGTVIQITLLLLISLLFPVSTSSQSSSGQPPGKLKGMVVDLRELPVPDASIVAESKNLIVTLKSTEEGKFEVVLPAGVYRITVSAPCTRIFLRKGVRVMSNAAQEVKAVLGPVECQ